MFSSDTLTASVTLASVIFIFIVFILSRYIYLSPKKKKYVLRKRNFLFFVGFAIFLFGMYICPIGTMEFFQLTRDALGLSFINNYILWIVIAAVTMILGTIIMLTKRSSEFVKNTIKKS